MPTLRHTNPYGACDVPLLGRVLDAGEEFECTADQARVLLAQADNYAAVDDTATAIVAELEAHYEEFGQRAPLTEEAVAERRAAVTPAVDLEKPKPRNRRTQQEG